MTEPPIGQTVETSPARLPQPVTLAGRFGRIEKLEPSRHGDDLWAAVKQHDAVWTYLAYGPFADEHSLFCWLTERAALADPYAYAVIDQAGQVLGIVTLMAIRPAFRVVEVGNILLSPRLQRTPLATETQYLLGRYVFEELGYRRLEWKCDALNAASRRAALRFGFTFEGIFRQHMIIKGHNRDTAWFAMLDSEWPERKSAYQQWLAPENFAADGQQKAKLGDLRRR